MTFAAIAAAGGNPLAGYWAFPARKSASVPATIPTTSRSTRHHRGRRCRAQAATEAPWSGRLRILYVGDVAGRSGRAVLLAELPRPREPWRPDAVIVNAENAAGGYGLTATIADEFLAAGADLLTMGNHVWDQRELIGHIDNEPRIVRLLNLAPGTPGRGRRDPHRPWPARARPAGAGPPVHGSGRRPVPALDAECLRHALGGSVQAIVVDIHAEATSEKLALAHHLDGRVSLVAGTHTHVPTADHRCSPAGRATSPISA